MPYYHVEITHNKSTQFVVNAADREMAEHIALTTDIGGKCDHKKIVKLRADSSSAVSISDTEKAAWTDTLKKAKANK